MIYNFIDTSAILNGALETIKNCVISPISLIELENIKDRKDKVEETKADARQAIRTLISNSEIQIVHFSQKEIKKIYKKYDFLLDINDHLILCAAELLGMKKDKQVYFYTCDGAQYTFAEQLPHIQPIMYKKRDTVEEYKGWREFYPSSIDLASLYTHPEQNVLGLKTNEFAKIIVDDKVADLGIWNGKKYTNLKYNNFTGPFGDKIAPRNIEQKMFFHLLQDDNIPVKLCVAKFGTGKSMLSITYALNAIQSGKYDKIVFVKNNLEVKGAGKLGILPGDEFSKQLPWLRQIEDHIGTVNFENYIAQNIIEPAHLSSLRGRDLKNCIILVDEAENLLATNIQLLLGRVAEGSQIIFCADVKQCDYIDNKMSGIPKMIQCLAGNPLFGMVTLLKTERSKIAALADKMD